MGKDAVTLNRATDHARERSAPAALALPRVLAIAVVVLAAWVAAASSAVAQVALPMPPESEPIAVRAERANRWQQGAYEVWVLRDAVEVRQGAWRASCREAALWIEPPEPSGNGRQKVLAYLEGDVRLERGRSGAAHATTGRSADALNSGSWFGRLFTNTRIAVDAPVTAFDPQVRPAVFERGLAQWDAEAQGTVAPAQYSPAPLLAPPSQPPTVVQPLTQNPQPAPPVPPPGILGPAAPSPPPRPSPPLVTPAVRPRSILIRSRGAVRMQGKVFPSPDGTETIAVISSGVNVIVDGVDTLPGLSGSKIDIETDRVVVWTARLDALDLTGESSGEKLQPRDAPLEFYLEGNVVFREGDRVIYAERMYYNVRGRYGVVLNAEVLSPAPGYQGLVRLKADVLQQLDQFNFQGFGAAVTSSRLGVPSYWVQAGQVTFQDIQRPLLDPYTGQPAIDPVTEEPAAVDHQYLATSRNNLVFVEGLPVIYWPVLATDLTKPNFYLDSFTIRNDNVFGFQVLTDWDVYQLLGVRDPPDGVRWTISPDYLSDRGFALGTEVSYDRQSCLALPGPTRGRLDAWGIRDSGLDNLGLDRRAVVPTTRDRGRLLFQHRQQLPQAFQLTAEVGWISDFNFLEQYYESEWDEAKDPATGLELKRFVEHSSWALSADTRLNDFFTQTEWLPRFDHYLIGQPVLGFLQWSGHSHVGYASLERGFVPPPPVNEPPETPLPWETDSLGIPWDNRQGVLAATRHELALPLPLGPFKIAPYLLGELAYWEEDVDAEDVRRSYGQAGIRGSLPIWSANPQVRSELWNLNGLAHKVTLDADFFWADADQPLERFPLYEPLNDDSIEHFERRFLQYEYTDLGLVLPPQLDARNFALRSGMQGWVTAASTEIADDLLLGKLGLRQRWQTKRGQPGQERIIDWIVLDIEGSFFPEAEEDNLGQSIGLVNYDFRWHLGDRFTLLSDGFFDFFDQGLQTSSLGGMLSRPLRGNVYLGFRTMAGPFTSNVVQAAINYRLSEKWIVNAGGTVALDNTGNVRENVSFTRIGESLLVRVGFYGDQSRDNFGVNFAVEPRFLSGSLSRVGGVPILPAGAFGLE